MRVLTIGSLNLDHTMLVDHLPEAGETLSALGYELTPGGKGLNQSVAAARAGAMVAHAGVYGNGGLWLK